MRLERKLLDKIYINHLNPFEMKVKRKDKIALVTLKGNPIEKNSFRDYLFAMATTIIYAHYNQIKENNMVVIDLNHLGLTNIPDLFNSYIGSIFKDMDVTKTIATTEYKKLAAKLYDDRSKGEIDVFKKV